MHGCASTWAAYAPSIWLSALVVGLCRGDSAHIESHAARDHFPLDCWWLDHVLLCYNVRITANWANILKQWLLMHTSQACAQQRLLATSAATIMRMEQRKKRKRKKPYHCSIAMSSIHTSLHVATLPPPVAPQRGRSCCLSAVYGGCGGGTAAAAAAASVIDPHLRIMDINTNTSANITAKITASTTATAVTANVTCTLTLSSGDGCSKACTTGVLWTNLGSVCTYGSPVSLSKSVLCHFPYCEL
jgi:hypothetical protein